MDTARIAALLRPFLADRQLSPEQLNQISIYIDILLRWNARMNLTAIREPEQVVTRHFGESLFAAWNLFPAPAARVVDVGSGAGFPGLPLKIWSPDVRLSLIESNQKKATFLREVARGLTLMDVDVFRGRAEDFPAASAELVTFRAVERFERSLPTAASLVAPGGTLALLIGASQAGQARELVPSLSWQVPLAIPQSTSRIVLRATQESG